MLVNRGHRIVRNWKPVVGMAVYIVPDDTRQDIWTGEISKIGRKYFFVTVKHHNPIKFDIETKLNIDWPYSVCYQSQEKYQESIKLFDKAMTIQDKIEHLTPEQINTVFNWISENLQK